MLTKHVTHPELDIVSVDDAMEHSRITDYDDEPVIQMCVESAHDMVQQWLNRKIVPTQMIGVVKTFKHEIILPYPPIISIDLINVDDGTEDGIDLTSDDYKFDDITGSVIFKKDYSMYSDIKITFTCGYDTDACPAAIKHAIRMTFATLYEMREDAIIGTQVNEVPVTARNIIRSYKVRSTG